MYFTSLLIFLIFISLSLIAFNLNKILISDNISTIHKEITNKVLIKLDSYLNIPHTINYLNDAFLRINPDHFEDLDLLRKYFYKQLFIFKTINLIAFGTEEGDYVEAQRLQDGRIRTGYVNKNNLELWKTSTKGQKLVIEKVIQDYDPRLRPWYETSKEKKTPAWSGIYLYSSNNQPAISSNQPYFSKNSEFSGVMTTSVTLDGISKFLSKLSLSNNSSVLIMEPSGLTIAASKEIPLLNSLNHRIPASNLEDHVFSSVSKFFLASTEDNYLNRGSEFPLIVENTKYLVRATPYYGPNNLKWNVLVIIPESDYMTAFYKATTYGIGILIFFLVLSVLASYLIARQTAKPIVILSDLVSEISWGDDTIKKWIIPEKILERRDEIGILAKAASEMSERLNAAFYEIRSSEKKYRELIEGTNSIILRLKPDGTILFANDYALKYFGYTEKELIDKKLQDTLLPDTAENGKDQSRIIRNIFDDNEHYWLNENENMKKNGEHVWFLWSNKLIMNEEKNKIELLAIGQDITIRKKAEKELSTSLAEKSILLGEIHHRVKNNLQIITSLINLQLADISNDMVQETLESLQSRIQSMALVHEMLYSTESFSEIDFFEYLHQIVTTISATHNRIKNPIQVSVEGDILYLDIDRSTTCGLLVNELIINAFKHAFKDQPDCRIDIIIEKKSEEIIIKVEDNGIGISTLNKSANKSGMGTLLIDALTDQLGGKMEVKENGGTSFILTFQI